MAIAARPVFLVIRELAHDFRSSEIRQELVSSAHGRSGDLGVTRGQGRLPRIYICRVVPGKSGRGRHEREFALLETWVAWAGGGHFQRLRHGGP